MRNLKNVIKKMKIWFIPRAKCSLLQIRNNSGCLKCPFIYEAFSLNTVICIDESQKTSKETMIPTLCSPRKTAEYDQAIITKDE